MYLVLTFANTSVTCTQAKSKVNHSLSLINIVLVVHISQISTLEVVNEMLPWLIFMMDKNMKITQTSTNKKNPFKTLEAFSFVFYFSVVIKLPVFTLFKLRAAFPQRKHPAFEIPEPAGEQKCCYSY